MPTNTVNLGLKTYNSTTDGSALFSTFRADQAGTATTSNMGLIDTWAGLVNGSLVSLSSNRPIYSVPASYISANYYEATVAAITAYVTNMVISLSLDTTSSGTVTLNINALGTKSLNKIDVDGVLSNFTATELKKSREYLFRYNGTVWILISNTSSDQVSAAGNSNNLLMISASGVIVDSGISASSVATNSGSYVTLSLNSNLGNEWLLSSGSSTLILQNTSASTVRVDVQATTPIISSGSSLTHATSGVVSGSYSNPTIIVDTTGHITSASFGGVYREMLVADRTYYVRTDGNDSNTGLVNSAGGAFLTMQKAIDVTAALDTSIYNVTIKVGDGTYVANGILKNILGSGSVTIEGNTTTPANVVIDGGFAKSSPGTPYWIKGFKLTRVTSATNIAINVTVGAYIQFSSLEFGVGFTYHLFVSSGGYLYNNSGNYTISGSAAAHLWVDLGGMVTNVVNTITLSGTPAFSSMFLYANLASTINMFSNTFSGSATGQRYLIQMNAAVYTNSGGANYFPGNSAGTVATGGQYV